MILWGTWKLEAECICLCKSIGYISWLIIWRPIRTYDLEPGEHHYKVSGIIYEGFCKLGSHGWDTWPIGNKERAYLILSSFSDTRSARYDETFDCCIHHPPARSVATLCPTSHNGATLVWKKVGRRMQQKIKREQEKMEQVLRNERNKVWHRKEVSCWGYFLHVPRTPALWPWASSDFFAFDSVVSLELRGSRKYDSASALFSCDPACDTCYE